MVRVSRTSRTNAAAHLDRIHVDDRGFVACMMAVNSKGERGRAARTATFPLAKVIVCISFFLLRLGYRVPSVLGTGYLQLPVSRIPGTLQIWVPGTLIRLRLRVLGTDQII